MKKYIAVFEVEDDCNILTIDAEVKYTYETNGTNWGAIEDIEFVKVEEPEQKTGKWRVQHTETRWIPSDAIFICSQCGHKKSRTDGEILNFCPNCGARMVSE